MQKTQSTSSGIFQRKKMTFFAINAKKPRDITTGDGSCSRDLLLPAAVVAMTGLEHGIYRSACRITICVAQPRQPKSSCLLRSPLCHGLWPTSSSGFANTWWGGLHHQKIGSKKSSLGHLNLNTPHRLRHQHQLPHQHQL
jgi:hypothetical protein